MVPVIIRGKAERLKSPGRDERFSIAKTPDFATRVHFFVIWNLRFEVRIWVSRPVDARPAV